jgi:hypothetical protein
MTKDQYPFFKEVYQNPYSYTSPVHDYSIWSEEWSSFVVNLPREEFS